MRNAKSNQVNNAIQDAAARFYGQHIAQGGVQALMQVWEQLEAIVAAFGKENNDG